jgi:hypothetical protein
MADPLPFEIGSPSEVDRPVEFEGVEEIIPGKGLIASQIPEVVGQQKDGYRIIGRSDYHNEMFNILRSKHNLSKNEKIAILTGGKPTGIEYLRKRTVKVPYTVMKYVYDEQLANFILYDEDVGKNYLTDIFVESFIENVERRLDADNARGPLFWHRITGENLSRDFVKGLFRFRLSNNILSVLEYVIIFESKDLANSFMETMIDQAYRIYNTVGYNPEMYESLLRNIVFDVYSFEDMANKIAGDDLVRKYINEDFDGNYFSPYIDESQIDRDVINDAGIQTIEIHPNVVLSIRINYKPFDDTSKQQNSILVDGERYEIDEMSIDKTVQFTLGDKTVIFAVNYRAYYDGINDNFKYRAIIMDNEMTDLLQALFLSNIYRSLSDILMSPLKINRYLLSHEYTRSKNRRKLRFDDIHFESGRTRTRFYDELNVLNSDMDDLDEITYTVELRITDTGDPWIDSDKESRIDVYNRHLLEIIMMKSKSYLITEYASDILMEILPENMAYVSAIFGTHNNLNIMNEVYVFNVRYPRNALSAIMSEYVNDQISASSNVEELRENVRFRITNPGYVMILDRNNRQITNIHTFTDHYPALRLDNDLRDVLEGLLVSRFMSISLFG